MTKMNSTVKRGTLGAQLRGGCACLFESSKLILKCGQQSMRNVCKTKYTTLFILDIIHGLVFTFNASCSTFCIDYFEFQPPLHISCVESQGYDHLFRLSLCSDDKSLLQLGAQEGNVVEMGVQKQKHLLPCQFMLLQNVLFIARFSSHL